MARGRTYLQAHIDHRNLHVLTACASSVDSSTPTPTTGDRSAIVNTGTSYKEAIQSGAEYNYVDSMSEQAVGCITASQSLMYA